MLRGCWCDDIVLNVHLPTEDKSDDTKDSLYEWLEQAFDHFFEHHIKIQFGDFSRNQGEKLKQHKHNLKEDFQNFK
jgi:23S rRNA C2498 (ribose-2'-O)-methylase RlmM